ncbi:unnamed protein product [Closterium sp. Yama58-4]|nr:unnamed protein product [Closterium sp. Yama58-4]
MLRPKFFFTVYKSVRAVIAASGSQAPRPPLSDSQSSQFLSISSHAPSLESPSLSNSSQPLSQQQSSPQPPPQPQSSSAPVVRSGVSEPAAETPQDASGSYSLYSAPNAGHSVPGNAEKECTAALGAPVTGLPHNEVANKASQNQQIVKTSREQQPQQTLQVQRVHQTQQEQQRSLLLARQGSPFQAAMAVETAASGNAPPAALVAPSVTASGGSITPHQTSHHPSSHHASSTSYAFLPSFRSLASSFKKLFKRRSPSEPVLQPRQDDAADLVAEATQQDRQQAVTELAAEPSSQGGIFGRISSTAGIFFSQPPKSPYLSSSLADATGTAGRRPHVMVAEGGLAERAGMQQMAERVAERIEGRVMSRVVARVEESAELEFRMEDVALDSGTRALRHGQVEGSSGVERRMEAAKKGRGLSRASRSHSSALAVRSGGASGGGGVVGGGAGAGAGAGVSNAVYRTRTLNIYAAPPRPASGAASGVFSVTASGSDSGVSSGAPGAAVAPRSPLQHGSLGNVRAFHVSEALKHLWDADAGLALFRWAKDVQGVKPDVYVYSTLFGLLGRGRDAANLARVVQEMREDGCEHNAVTLQSLATAYGRAGRWEEALATLGAMQGGGERQSIPHDLTLIGPRVDALFRTGRYSDAIKAFTDLRNAGHVPDSLVCNTVLTCYSRVSHPRLFSPLPRVSPLSSAPEWMLSSEWAATAMRSEHSPSCATPSTCPTSCPRVDALFRMGRYSDAIRAFAELRSAGHVPDSFVYNTVLTCYGRVGNSTGAEEAFKDMIRHGVALDVRCANSLMDAYGRAGQVDDAMAVFDRMCLAAVAAGGASHVSGRGGGRGKGRGKGSRGGEEGHARDWGGSRNNAHLPGASAVAGIPPLNPHVAADNASTLHGSAARAITYSCAIHLLSMAGRLTEAEETFEAMLVAGMHPDTITWSTMVQVWAKEANPERAAMWFRRMVAAGCRPETPAYNSLIWAFVRRGMFDEAGEVLTALKHGGEVESDFLPGRIGLGNAGTSASAVAGAGSRSKAGNAKLDLTPNLMTYTMFLSECTESAARSDVARLLRLMEETEHAAHAVFQLLMEEPFESTHVLLAAGAESDSESAPLSGAVCGAGSAAGYEAGDGESRCEGESEGGRCEEVGWGAVRGMIERGLVEVEVRGVVGEWEEERWQEVERRMRGSAFRQSSAESQRAFADACIAFLHKFGRHERAARMWDLCHTRLRLYPCSIQLPAISGQGGECFVDLHGMSAGTAVTVTKWALEKMRQAVVASAAAGAVSGAASAASPSSAASAVANASTVANPTASPDTAVGATQIAESPTESSSASESGAAEASPLAESPPAPALQWQQPSKVAVVTGWGKRSRVQGASLVKAAVEALLLRDLTAPFSLHRFHPGSYEAPGADLEAWLLTPGVEQLLAPRDEG